MNLVDSDEDDEDFVFTKTMEQEAYSEESTFKPKEENDLKTALHKRKTRAKADAAWLEMTRVPSPAISTSNTSSSTKQKKAAKKAQASKKKAKSMIADIFGKTVSKDLVSRTSFVPKKSAAGSISTTAIKALIRPRTKNVVEKKKFAGRTIEVIRQVANPDDEDDNSNSRTKGANNLDSLLTDLAGPSKVSTIAKTSSDWDTFKDKKGVGEELEKNNKNGYLTKKDFLNRVDQRQFELEKAKRDVERARRG